jgi:hypothetical protein
MGKRAKGGFQIWCAILLAGCSTAPVVPKGETTLRGRGAQVLTEKGDPMMQTGPEARKVPADFAAGYAKGISDQVKRSYWAQQDDEASASQAGYSDSGKVKLYDVTVPEHRDADGVIRVERRVKIPMVE